MTKMDKDHVKQHIEVAIERARENVSERIDEIDQKLRSSLDFGQMAGDHAPEFLAAGTVLGVLLGLGAPKLLTRGLALGIPLVVALQVVKRARNHHDTPAIVEDLT